MDAHKAGAAAGGGGGGEVRRINVVYFLSRGGRTDHPHLFRVNHLNRAGSGGVRLRDVKRWLSELRGKDMPDNYSWSYKRKYKAGYVWQDLKDDDLITPVSDNEYVLKGCDVRGTPPPPCVQAPRRTCSLVEKKRKEEEEGEVRTPCNDDQNRPVEVVLTPDSDESSPKPPPPADQDSPGGCESARRGTVPFKVDKPQGLDEQKQQQEQVVITIEVSRSQSRRQQKHFEDDEEGEATTEKADTTTKAAAPAKVEEQQPKGEGAAGGGVRGHAHAHAVGKQARRMRVARALHNMMTCARADADDAALRPVARQQASDDWPPPPTPTCPGMEVCGLRVSRKAARPRDGGNGKDKQRKRDGEKKHDAHKPPTLPRCSQCGKEFKPQELHSHMQSCRGFKKERMRSSTSARPSTDKRRNRTAGGHYSSESERPSSASAVFLLTES